MLTLFASKAMKTPSFSIYDPATGKSVDTLQTCHIKRQKMSRNDLPAMICADDGHIYTAVYDGRFPAGAEEVEVIISFQVHSYGKFAVVRIAKPKRRSTYDA